MASTTSITDSSGILTVSWGFSDAAYTIVDFDFTWGEVTGPPNIAAFTYTETLSYPTAASIATMINSAVAARQQDTAIQMIGINANGNVWGLIFNALIARGFSLPMS